MNDITKDMKHLRDETRDLWVKQLPYGRISEIKKNRIINKYRNVLVMSEDAKEFRGAHEADLINNNPTYPQVLKQVLLFHDINISKLSDIVNANKLKMEKYISDFQSWETTKPNQNANFLSSSDPDSPLAASTRNNQTVTCPPLRPPRVRREQGFYKESDDSDVDTSRAILRGIVPPLSYSQENHLSRF